MALPNPGTPSVYVLPVAAFVLHQQSLAAAETGQPAKPEIFTLARYLEFAHPVLKL